jgi:glutamyl-tRNA synthetase
MQNPVRVRFAPSPTGALHIGGVRTALYNYLLARKTNGTFILRIEDTDQNRFVEGAESYIEEALNWLGLNPDEGVNFSGEFGPYRQSDRKELYRKYADFLIEKGHAYYAFDSAEELDILRKQYESEGKTFKYDASTRLSLNNSLTQSEEVTNQYLSENNYVIRIKLPANEIVKFNDLIREDVEYNTNDMDDKVMLKGSDNMPTYHLANVVDDYLMKITHVIRGEEWLPSTPLHVLLYRFLGWEEQRPIFAHLPLILRPDGKGKLSKRDGAKFGIPVFPLNFTNPNNQEDIALGFRDWGFEPEAVINFLALLGWHPSSDKEIFDKSELVEAFELERVSKSGARFDFEKACWFNQQYIMKMSNAELATKMRPYVDKANFEETVCDEYLESVAALMKERVVFVKEFVSKGYYFFKLPDYALMMEQEGKDFEKKVLSNWDANRKKLLENLVYKIENLETCSAQNLQTNVESFIAENGLKFGDVLPVLRLALSGTMKGPGVFEMMELIGKEYVKVRLLNFFDFCNAMAIKE